MLLDEAGKGEIISPRDGPRRCGGNRGGRNVYPGCAQV